MMILLHHYVSAVERRLPRAGQGDKVPGSPVVFNILSIRMNTLIISNLKWIRNK